MFKKHYIIAIVSFLLIPVVSVLGAMLFGSINPEIAAGHPNYERNYRLLDMTKHISSSGRSKRARADVGGPIGRFVIAELDRPHW